jgi:hypothetical protein
MTMEHGTIDQAPEGLRAFYEGDLAPAPFTVDDVVTGGRRRRRRRTLAGVGGGVAAVAVLALAVGAGAGVLADGSTSGGVAPAATSSAPTRTAAAAQPGCTDAPLSCLTVVSDWSRAVAGSSATVVEADPSAYEAGTVVLQQAVSSVRGQQDIHLSVVIAPTSLAAQGEVAGPETPHEEELPGLRGPFVRLTTVGGGNFGDRWQLAAEPGVHPALEVSINVANQGPVGGPFDEAADHVAAPSWWSEASVARLVEALVGTDTLRATPSLRCESTGWLGGCRP